MERGGPVLRRQPQHGKVSYVAVLEVAGVGDSADEGDVEIASARSPVVKWG
jgi:hypothetical protein